MKALETHCYESRLLRPYSPLQGFHGFYGIFRWHLAHAPVMNYVQLERAVFIKRHRKWLVTGMEEIFHVHAIFSMALDVDLIWAGVVLCVPGLDTR